MERTRVVTAEFRESYELLFSLAAFCQRKLQIATDLRSDWQDWVKKRISIDLSNAALASGDFDLTFFLQLAASCPAHDAVGYLQWLKEPAAAALHYAQAKTRPERASRSRELRGVTHLLDLWHSEYFCTVDASVLTGLKDDAGEKNRLLLTTKPEDVIESATQGLTLVGNLTGKPLILAPQYHCRPYSMIVGANETFTLFYPADGLPLWGQNVPIGVPRLARALSDATRVEILNFLKSGPKRFTDIAQHTGSGKSTVVYHLTMLRAAGLLSVLVDEWEAKQYSMRGHIADLLTETFTQFLRA